MTKKTILQIIIGGLILLSGCATTANKHKLMLDGIYFENNSKYKLDQIKVTVKKTGAFASCSPVIAHSICSTQFEPLIYQGNPIYITWVQDEIIHPEPPFVIDPPKEILEDQSAKVIIRFDRHKQISAHISY